MALCAIRLTVARSISPNDLCAMGPASLQHCSPRQIMRMPLSSFITGSTISLRDIVLIPRAFAGSRCGKKIAPCANPPWNKRTRVRGVEFGSSPMPLGLAHARENGPLVRHARLRFRSGGSCLEAQYDLFLHPTPTRWSKIADVQKKERTLIVRGDNDEEINFQRQAMKERRKA